MRMDSATGKRLLALIRDADYAHPGEEEANRLLFAGLPPDPSRRILDAGSGGGGTAAWVTAQGYGEVTGLEIDAETVALARTRHPSVTFVRGDLQRAGGVLAGPFDLAYSMTALYAVPDKAAALAQLAALAAPGGELRLLEYSDPGGRFAEAARGAGWAWWLPLEPGEVPALLAHAGWRTTECRDLSPRFQAWYEDLCRRIAAKRAAITGKFGAAWYEFVAAEYAGILGLVRDGALGGLLVRARAVPTQLRDRTV
jgi:SAM-dependent methyltransferase